MVLVLQRVSSLKPHGGPKLEHNFIRAQAPAPKRRRRARLFLQLGSSQGWRFEHTFIRGNSPYPLICRYLDRSYMTGQRHRLQRRLKSPAYLHNKQIYPCCLVQVLRWSSNARAQALLYFHVGRTYLSCHVHRIEGSMAWPGLVNTFIKNQFTHSLMYYNWNKA